MTRYHFRCGRCGGRGVSALNNQTVCDECKRTEAHKMENPERIPEIAQLAGVILQAAALAFQRKDHTLANMAAASACGLLFALTRYDASHARAAHFAFRCSVFVISPDGEMNAAERALLRESYKILSNHGDPTSDISALLYPHLRTTYTQYIEEVEALIAVEEAQRSRRNE
jgi:hypothetical protein